MYGEVNERLVVPDKIRKTALFEVDILIILLLILLRMRRTFILLNMQEDLLHGGLIHDIDKRRNILMIGQRLDLSSWVTLYRHYNQIPNYSFEFQFLDPAIFLIIENELKKLIEDRERSLRPLSREDDLREGEECTNADVLDDWAGEAAIEAYRVDTDEDVFSGVLQEVRIDEAESSLDDSQGHIYILVFVLQQHYDIYDMVENGIHLLAETHSLEHFLPFSPLGVIHDLYESYHLCKDAED